MNDLVIINEETNEPMTTSLLVAEAFDKRHFDVMRIVTKLAEGDERNFSFISYTDSMNRQKPAYEMTRKGFTRLVMEFSGPKASKVKDKFNDAFYQMEEHIRKQQQVFDPTKLSRLEILQMAIEAEQKVLQLEEKVKEDQPKVELVDAYMNTKGNYALTDAARMLGLKPNKFTEYLRNEGTLSALCKGGKPKNTPSSYHMAKGYFVLQPVYTPSVDRTFEQPRVTPKGFDWLHRRKQRGDFKHILR